MNQFSEHYKTLSNSDLFNVIQNKNKYESKAVQAAQNEIENRRLTQADISEAKNQLERQQELEQRKSEKLEKQQALFLVR